MNDQQVDKLEEIKELRSVGGWVSEEQSDWLIAQCEALNAEVERLQDKARKETARRIISEIAIPNRCIELLKYNSCTCSAIIRKEFNL